MIKDDKIRIYAGVSVMTLALMMHMGLNVNPNTRTNEVAIDNSQKIIVQRELEENPNDRRSGR